MQEVKGLTACESLWVTGTIIRELQRWIYGSKQVFGWDGYETFISVKMYLLTLLGPCTLHMTSDTRHTAH